ncbi:SDR family oxidoreductase [Corynebacterium sp. 335C]
MLETVMARIRGLQKFIPNKYRMPVKGRVVLVTGSGSGIGRLMAQECAARGAARVIGWDMDPARNEETRRIIESAGGVFVADTVDVTDQDAVEAAAERAGDVDILINNAGVVSGREFLDTSQESVDRTFNVNVRSLYLVTRPFLRGMVERNRGTVVNVASAAGIVGVAKQTDYSASKFAAVGFSESLRVEMKTAGHRINVMSLCPFYIDTGMFEGVQAKVPFLFPILDPGYVARETIDAIERGSHQLIVPTAARMVFVGRLLPSPVFDLITKVLGINHTMDHFRGRAGDRV